MKKLICTAMVMVAMMTSVGAVNTTANNRNFGDYVREGVEAQLNVRQLHYASNWGIPMLKTHIDLFGIKNLYVEDVYDFKTAIARP